MRTRQQSTWPGSMGRFFLLVWSLTHSTVLVNSWTTTPSSALLSSRSATVSSSSRVVRMASNNDDESQAHPRSLARELGTWATSALLAATLWSSGGANPTASQQQHLSMMPTPPAALAKEMASGSGSRVNKDPESLLRYGLPINNNEVRRILCRFSIIFLRSVGPFSLTLAPFFFIRFVNCKSHWKISN